MTLRFSPGILYDRISSDVGHLLGCNRSRFDGSFAKTGQSFDHRLHQTVPVSHIRRSQSLRRTRSTHFVHLECHPGESKTPRRSRLLLIKLCRRQILCIYDALEEINLEQVAKYVAGLQQPDGSFFGDKWGEVDTRFSFCAVMILSLIVSVEGVISVSLSN